MIYAALLAAAALANAGAAADLPAATPADIAWIAEGGFCEPETVLPLPDGTFLVSNVCDFRARGTGYLTLLGADGSVLKWRAVDKLDAPLGMARLGDRLFVVDANRVRVLRWPGLEAIEIIELSTGVANDIAVDERGTLYVSDSGRGDVLRVGRDGSETWLAGEGKFPDANGLALDGDRLFIGGVRLWCLDLPSGRVERIGPGWLADIDGIEFEPDGTLQVTPVGGPLIRYRSDQNYQVLGGEGVSSANHGYAPAAGLALIPTGFDQTVIALRVPKWPESVNGVTLPKSNR